MKLVFSEYKQDLKNYIYSYVVWAYPDKETSADMFGLGFLAGEKDFSRWYKTRSIRVVGKEFVASSENRRILRKGKGISFQVVGRKDFDCTDEVKRFCKEYADIRFGKDVMTGKRALDIVFNSKCCSDVMVFVDEDKKQEVGYVVLYIEGKRMVHYYYGFYDLNYYARNLGMYMMTAAVDYFSRQGFDYIYLGTCYTKNALYKTQFKGVEFYNGVDWSREIKELKYMIKRQSEEISGHLFGDEEYVSRYMN